MFSFFSMLHGVLFHRGSCQILKSSLKAKRRVVYALRLTIRQVSARKRAALSLYYVLKYVGETALSGLLMFSAASLVRTGHSRLKRSSRVLCSSCPATFIS
jgi:hypothetical protein